MTDGTPRRLKLRGSCDGCGTAKLKCDRGQPECARCVSLCLLCTYGFSRKCGKPSRAKQAERRNEVLDNTGDAIAAQNSDSVLLDATNNNIDSLMTGDYTPDPYGQFLVPLPADSAFFDLDEWVFPLPSSDNLLNTTWLGSGNPSTQAAVKSTIHQID
ncbi:hypothetical protein MMC27_005640 [Xylographa pallens]|nr:hypothetical protein [Xylographa pallens]